MRKTNLNFSTKEEGSRPEISSNCLPSNSQTLNPKPKTETNPTRFQSQGLSCERVQNAKQPFVDRPPKSSALENERGFLGGVTWLVARWAPFCRKPRKNEREMKDHRTNRFGSTQILCGQH